MEMQRTGRRATHVYFDVEGLEQRGDGEYEDAIDEDDFPGLGQSRLAFARVRGKVVHRYAHRPPSLELGEVFDEKSRV